MTIRFDRQVAIVTGAGNGLGKSHALALAARGAKLMVNDLGVSVDGVGGSISVAEDVASEIREAGGEAISHGANVCNRDEVKDMVDKTMARWGRVDILINNAGILRDKSFVKMDLDDFNTVLQVHLMGSVICSKAVWEIMREQNYGRIVMTTSSSGLYGNFGQSNYGAAKMGLVGLMNTLCIEGQKYGIHINALSPCGATRMFEGLLPVDAFEVLKPEAVTTGLLTLCDGGAPNRTILAAGGGGFSHVIIYETEGIHLSLEELSPENVRAAMDRVSDPNGQEEFRNGSQQTMKFLKKSTN
ncbi:MAG: SDR family NAD(P)-dependent oxidoreductase [Sphingomonadales bacterium]|jgi:NAD(P)-dependent dehydrogenase (short-subunit alcohol dehydrogenase family)